MKTNPFRHGRPQTRREFLSEGLIAFSATTLLPTPFGFLNKALADVECGGAQSSLIPFLVFDCAGGAALPANFLVGGPGGPTDLLKSYNQLGWDPKSTPESLSEEFGLPMSQVSSRILQGIRASASAEARKNFRLASFCHAAQSDSSSNPLNAAALIAKFGYKGSILGQGVGTENSVSGGNSQLGFPAPSYRAIFVPSVQTLIESVGLSKASALGVLSNGALGRFFSLGNRLSKTQIESLSATHSKELLTLSECSYLENEKKVEHGSAAIDPRLDTQFQSVYGIDQDSPSNNPVVVSAAIVKNVLSQTTGPGVITIGGCDYHDGTSTTGDNKDEEIGVQIGRAIEAAHLLKKPLFIQLITDGGCSNIVGTRQWISDANEKCMTVIGYYRPDGPMAQRRLQVGHYTSGQGADTDALGGLGGRPIKVTAAVFANYVNLHVPQNQLTGEVFKYVPSDLFNGAEELKQTLVFGA